MKRGIISALLGGIAGINIDRDNNGKISWTEVLQAIISLGTTAASVYLGFK